MPDTRRPIKLSLARLVKTANNGSLELADPVERAEVTALVTRKYVSAIDSFDRAKLATYPLNSHVIVGRYADSDEVKLTVALKIAYTEKELDDLLEVDPPALFGYGLTAKLRPAAIAARAACDIRGAYPAVRPFMLNLAWTLSCSVQLGFNSNANGIAETMGALGYTVYPVPEHLAGRAIFGDKKAQCVTRLDRQQFKPLAMLIMEQIANGDLPRVEWADSARDELRRLEGNAWF